MNNDPINEGKTYSPEQYYDAAIGVHAVCGVCNFAGGALHLPIVKAVVKSDLQNFWKFLATATIAGNAIECFRKGSKEFQKIVELCIGPEEQEVKPGVKKPDQNTEDPGLHEVKIEQ